MKQYLMLCDEKGMEVLKSAFRPECVQFVEVQGMNIGSTNQFNVLITPIIPAITQAVLPVEPIPEKSVE